MPRKYVKRKSKRTRRSRKKMPRYKRIPYQMPAKMAIKQKYTDFVNLNAGAVGTPAVYSFRANSVYDPDFTSGGHQPRGHDQMMLFYQHCTVIASKIVVTFVPDQVTDLAQATVCGIELSDNSTSITASLGVSQAMESKFFRYITLAPDYSGTKTVSQSFGIKKFFKVGSGSILSEDQYRSSNSSNPSELAFFHVGVGPTGSVDLNNIKGIVKLVYTCVYHGLQDPGQS